MLCRPCLFAPTELSLHPACDCFHRINHTLAFSLNGVDLGVAFHDLPRCVCSCVCARTLSLRLTSLPARRYSDGLVPAVCMGATGSGVGIAAHQLMLIRTKHE